MADNQSPELFGQTPWQTVGPFFHYALPWRGGADLVGSSDIGARLDLVPPGHFMLSAPAATLERNEGVIEITGRLLDANGEPIPDAMLEIWQADTGGIHADPAGREGFIGFGRASTSADGAFTFRTVTPGRVTTSNGGAQAPHIAMGVFGRGLIKRLVTRLYFEGDPANDEDPVLALVPPERRGTLMARREENAWRFDIVLQGERETVFFDV